MKEASAAVSRAFQRAFDAQQRAVEIHRRAADLHGRAAEFYASHAKLDRLAGYDELAAEMEKRAEHERELQAGERRKVEQAEPT